MLVPALLKVCARVVHGCELLQLPSILTFPVRISPPVRTFTETVSIVKRAVFVGVNARALLLVGTKRNVYVPFAHTAVQVIPQQETVTVPTVHADIVNVQRCSLPRCIPETV